MATVKAILKVKGDDVATVSPDTTALDAVKRMVGRGVGCLLVVQDKKILGIVGERDYLRKVVVGQQFKPEDPVEKIMTQRVVFVTPERSTEECMALMTEKRIRHLPVMENDTLVGLVSIGDLLKSTISEKEFLISHLESYITNSER